MDRGKQEQEQGTPSGNLILLPMHTCHRALPLQSQQVASLSRAVCSFHTDRPAVLLNVIINRIVIIVWHHFLSIMPQRIKTKPSEFTPGVEVGLGDQMSLLVTGLFNLPWSAHLAPVLAERLPGSWPGAT